MIQYGPYFGAVAYGPYYDLGADAPKDPLAYLPTPRTTKQSWVLIGLSLAAGSLIYLFRGGR